MQRPSNLLAPSALENALKKSSKNEQVEEEQEQQQLDDADDAPAAAVVSNANYGLQIGARINAVIENFHKIINMCTVSIYEPKTRDYFPVMVCLTNTRPLKQKQNTSEDLQMKLSKFYVHRDVQLRIDGVNNERAIFGSIFVKENNKSEVMLQEQLITNGYCALKQRLDISENEKLKVEHEKRFPPRVKPADKDSENNKKKGDKKQGKEQKAKQPNKEQKKHDGKNNNQKQQQKQGSKKGNK